MSSSIVIIWVAGIAGITVLAAFFIARKVSAKNQVQQAEATVKKALEEANIQIKKSAEKARVDADQEIRQSRRNLEEEFSRKRQEIDKTENRLMEKQRYLDSRDGHISEKEEFLDREVEKVKNLRERHEKGMEELTKTLEKVAGLSQEEAREKLLANVEQQSRKQAGIMIKNIEEQARKVANRKAKEIVLDAIQRTAVDHVVSATTSAVNLPDEDMKGRVIGREGRNIRAFEQVTGVDVIIDDTPGAVILSCFDPIRREVARIAMKHLVTDGRIHPARIEETVEKAREELTGIIREKGEEAAEKLNLTFHPKIIELLGRLHYRTSYGQNILQHAIETSLIAGIMATELGVNVNLAKRGGVLHDIGKALDFEHEGSHVTLGEDICRKYGESEEVINCINAHHEDEEAETVEAVLVTVADAISSVRPGARKESLETYVKRLEKLEALATSYEGVEKAYAIQAGREVRVVVRPEIISDEGVYKLAHDMARKIEMELEYPGEVRVSVIRETRSSDIAR